MTLRSGMAIQCGYAAETTPGVGVTPTTFLPVVELPSLTVGGDATESDGIIAGRTVLTSDQWNGGNLKVGGDVGHELLDHGQDFLFRAMLGSMSQTGSTGAYTHVHTPGPLDDDALTVQVGIPSISGTVIPSTYTGCHVASWEIACQQGAIATLGVTFAGMRGHIGSRTIANGGTTNASPTVTAATATFVAGDIGKPITGAGIPAGARIVAVASDGLSCTISAAATAAGTGVSLTIGMPLATATYPSALKPLKSMYLTATIGGLSVPVKNFTVGGDNALDAERYTSGTPFPDQPLEAGLRSYTGTIDVEWPGTFYFEAFRNGSELALAGLFKRGANSVKIEGNCRFDANPPSGKGREIVEQSVPVKFIASGATDDTALKITTVNPDNVT